VEWPFEISLWSGGKGGGGVGDKGGVGAGGRDDPSVVCTYK
jgi:hypothetical protein